MKRLYRKFRKNLKRTFLSRVGLLKKVITHNYVKVLNAKISSIEQYERMYNPDVLRLLTKEELETHYIRLKEYGLIKQKLELEKISLIK